MRMTMMPFNYDNYDISNSEPEWMRAERYDYCEGGLTSFIEKKNHGESLRERVSKLFSKKSYKGMKLAG